MYCLVGKLEISDKRDTTRIQLEAQTIEQHGQIVTFTSFPIVNIQLSKTYGRTSKVGQLLGPVR